MNKWTSSFLLIFVVLINYLYNNTNISHPNAGLNITGLVTKFGYPLEIHEITTKDGYILTLHRIPNKKSVVPTKRLPILLLPGMLNSAAEFVSLGPDKALGLMLSNKNFDVWMGNFRGTTWSRKHTHFNADEDQSYWNYTLHEMGIYDVPALVDYVLDKTNQSQLYYVGFSQANTVAFAMLSELPEFNKKIKLMLAMAPSLFLENTQSPLLSTMFRFTTITESLLYYSGPKELLPLHGLGSKLHRYVCNKNSYLFNVCRFAYFIMQGGMGNTDLDFFPVIATSMPAGSSSYVLLHNMQLTGAGEFVRFNFGKRKNLEVYGQETPFAYDIGKITVPIAFYYSKNDKIISEENILKVSKIFARNVVKVDSVSASGFNHMDFLVGSKTKKLYDSIINQIENY